ncbi:MAG: FCSD flavin-binding domain-containing protein [Gammaproteobacteria bacterium]
MDKQRRRFIRSIAGTGAVLVSGLPLLTGCGRKAHARVVVIGGGYAGATCAKYIRKLDAGIEVTLIEPKPYYMTCPFSNLVIGGIETLEFIRHDYRPLQRNYGVNVVHARAASIDADKQSVQLQDGRRLGYDRLIVAPGISFKWGSPQGYDEQAARDMPHAWQAGAQTQRLRRQLLEMDNGGVVAIAVPLKPFRCPPGPYERASLIAYYLKQHKPRCKVLILDANEKFSKQAVFLEAWEALYPGMIERISVLDGGTVLRVEPKTRTLFTELDEYKVAVANVIPAQRAGLIAMQSDLVDQTGWCPVHQDTFESLRVGNVHVLGDSCYAGAMPKSASSANSQAKLCSLAVVTLLNGEGPPEPVYHNTCYSLVRPGYAFSVTAMYRYRDGQITAVTGAGGVSPVQAPRKVREREAGDAYDWYASINADSFGYE